MIYVIQLLFKTTSPTVVHRVQFRTPSNLSSCIKAELCVNIFIPVSRWDHILLMILEQYNIYELGWSARSVERHLENRVGRAARRCGFSRSQRISGQRRGTMLGYRTWNRRLTTFSRWVNILNQNFGTGFRI